MRTYTSTGVTCPDLKVVPEAYRECVQDLFSVWSERSARNYILSEYYTMKNSLKMLGISIPADARFQNLNCVTGWCSKAVHAHVNRSTFDGFVFGGRENPDLNRLVRQNRIRSLYKQALISTLVHGISAFTVMAGDTSKNQPRVKVRTYSASQFSVLWDKDEGRIAAGVVLSDTDREGHPIKYVVHLPDAVLTLVRHGSDWSCIHEYNPMGRPLMEVLVYDPDTDRPLGHSMLTPELLGIVDKAMRDIMRMEVGAEFFTFPQRYAIGVAEDLFTDAVKDEDGLEDEDAERVPNQIKKFQAYIGSLWAITRDENGDVPTVGQFIPTNAENFTLMFENDAQRFSGATNVPLGQLGVLSNTYTSSDALGAANDPLILEVQAINLRNAEALEEIARMMMAVEQGVSMLELPDDLANVQAYMSDPSMPTIAARADAWTKLGGADASIVGTRVYYEGIGLTQATIERLEAEKKTASVIDALTALAGKEKPVPHELSASQGVDDD